MPFSPLFVNGSHACFNPFSLMGILCGATLDKDCKMILIPLYPVPGRREKFFEQIKPAMIRKCVVRV